MVRRVCAPGGAGRRAPPVEDYRVRTLGANVVTMQDTGPLRESRLPRVARSGARRLASLNPESGSGPGQLAGLRPAKSAGTKAMWLVSNRQDESDRDVVRRGADGLE